MSRPPLPTLQEAVLTITASDDDRQAKLEALRQLERDVLARSVANEEGMSGPVTLADVGIVRVARRRLGDPELAHEAPPTKY